MRLLISGLLSIITMYVESYIGFLKITRLRFIIISSFCTESLNKTLMGAFTNSMLMMMHTKYITVLLFKIFVLFACRRNMLVESGRIARGRPKTIQVVNMYYTNILYTLLYYKFNYMVLVISLYLYLITF